MPKDNDTTKVGKEIKRGGRTEGQTLSKGEVVGQIGPIGKAAADKKKTCRGGGESLVPAQGTTSIQGCQNQSPTVDLAAI